LREGFDCSQSRLPRTHHRCLQRSEVNPVCPVLASL
jgi:hypothetical protein